MAARAKVIARSPQLRRSGGFWATRSDYGVVCDKWIAKHFNVPNSAKSLTLVGYDQPISTYTMSVRMPAGQRYVVSGGGGNPTAVPKARQLIEQHIGHDRTFHLGVEYA